jgi:hypothetical protein
VKTQYFKKHDFSRSIQKNSPVSKKKLKMPEVASMLHIKYQLKISARVCNPKKNWYLP